MSAKLQLYVFAAAVALLTALVVWAGHSAWRELQVLRKNLTTVRAESFNLADQVEAQLRELNETVLRFDLRRDESDQAAFDKGRDELRRELGAHRATMSTQQELELLEQIEIAFGNYATNAARLMAERSQPGATASPQLTLDRLSALAAPVLELVNRLTVVQGTALNELVKESNAKVEVLQRLLLASVVLVVLLGFTATRLIYRARIAPLRAEIIQSRAVLERQEKLASLGTLAAGVAHEIRNPLTAINVRVHSLKRTLAAGTSEREDVTVIDEEIRRLDRIVRDFLDFARPSPPQLVTVHVESLFHRVQSLLGAQWRKSSIQLNVEPPGDLWIRVDTHQLEQVLINLVQNAADSIEGEGTITLRARPEPARIAGLAAPAVVIEVVDTGKGIPPEVQKRIFDPFFTTKENGTGLGLAIAASIVEKHGGVLQCRTQVGRGTTFGIVLPRAEKDEHESQT
jgi:signal transduction histidine kinase